MLSIAPFLERDLPAEEWQELRSMIGEVFEVCDVDEYGAAWVEKTWRARSGLIRHCSLALASHEMEVVEQT